jgi:peptidyl-prolyl cis-trans isomerase C
MRKKNSKEIFMFALRHVAPVAALLMAALYSSPAFSADAAVKEPAAAAKPAEAAKTHSASDVMVRVNGTAITRREVDRAVKIMLAQNQMVSPNPEIMAQAQEAALDQLTSAELLYQEAAKVKVKDLDKQVSERVAKSKAKFTSDADFQKALEEVDMTPKDIEDFARKDILIANLIEERFAAKAAVSDEEARKFYNDNLDKYFKKPETARASHILISADEKATPEERKKAKEKAEAILKRVNAGEDFAAIAKADSSCPSSAQGGDLGSFTRGQMVPSFDKAVFTMKPGEVSDVVETQFGYHVIKLTERHEASTDKFEDVKGKINDYLKKEKIQNEVLQYVEGLKKAAKIEKP